MLACLLGARRPGCNDPRRFTWISGLGDDERATLEIGFLKRTITLSGTNRSVPGPGLAGRWYGDDHSRLVLTGTDIVGTARRQVLFNYPLARIRPVEALEVTWDNQFDGDSMPVAVPFPTFDAARSAEIGYCSIPIPWSARQDPSFAAGTGLADQIARVTDEVIVSGGLHRSQNWQPPRYLVHLAAHRTGASADSLCFAAGPYHRPDDALCSFVGAWLAYCVRFSVAPAPNQPAYLDLAIELTEATAYVQRVTVGACSRVQAQQALVEELDAVAPMMTEVLNDCLWQREIPDISGGTDIGAIFDGCRLASTATVRPNLRCDFAGDTQEERDARCRARFPGVRARCEQREGDDRPVCYWNLEVDGVEVFPSRAELVLALDREPGGALDGSLRALRAAFGVGAEAIEAALCRAQPVTGTEDLPVVFDRWEQISLPGN